MSEQVLAAGHSSPPAIRLDGVTVRYGSLIALDNLSLNLPTGQLVGSIGPNGSGKSTLIKTILGFQRCERGRVLIMGESIAASRGRVAYVPQRGTVDWDFPVTVRDVVLMGRYGRVPWWRELSAADQQSVTQALQQVGLADLASRQIGRLSGGQQQRVFLARALAQEASILLLDEPFTGVDAATEQAILEVLRGSRQAGRTVVVVHHDLATAGRYFDHLVLLRQRLFAEGGPAAVLRPELLREVYGGRLQIFGDLVVDQRGAT
ncbi:MAG: metal ABC transporter ATP-binding protein [Planctomycetota bacterium]